MTAVTGKKQGRGRQENANAIEKKSDAASRQDDPVTIGPTSWAPCKHPNNQNVTCHSEPVACHPAFFDSCSVHCIALVRLCGSLSHTHTHSRGANG
jgi:hypothetical protein